MEFRRRNFNQQPFVEPIKLGSLKKKNKTCSLLLESMRLGKMKAQTYLAFLLFSVVSVEHSRFEAYLFSGAVFRDVFEQPDHNGTIFE